MITLVQPKLAAFYRPLKVKMKPLTVNPVDTVQLQPLLKMTENVAHTASTPDKQPAHKIKNKHLNYLNQILFPVSTEYNY